MSNDTDWNLHLASILQEFACQTGTIHRSGDGKTLHLVCQVGVPDSLMDKVAIIPFGKGIAGAAAERMEPVELCNLQEDLGGVAKADARKTGVSGSIALPIFRDLTGRVIGTLGIGKFAPYEFTDVEKRRLEQIATEIALLFDHKASAGD